MTDGENLIGGWGICIFKGEVAAFVGQVVFRSIDLDTEATDSATIVAACSSDVLNVCPSVVGVVKEVASVAGRGGRVGIA